MATCKRVLRWHTRRLHRQLKSKNAAERIAASVALKNKKLVHDNFMSSCAKARKTFKRYKNEKNYNDKQDKVEAVMQNMLRASGNMNFSAAQKKVDKILMS